MISGTYQHPHYISHHTYDLSVAIMMGYAQLIRVALAAGSLYNGSTASLAHCPLHIGIAGPTASLTH